MTVDDTLPGMRLTALFFAAMLLQEPIRTADITVRGLKPSDFDLIELNEAFAAQVLACDRELHFDPQKLNVNGGAIALGHPIGCTGTRITVTLLHEMLRRKAHRGVATLCVSGGMGMALAIESVS